MSGTFTLQVIDSHNVSNKKFIEWLGQEGLLELTRTCQQCQRPLHLQHSTNFPLDGYEMRCTHCHTRESVRKLSLFEGSHLTLPTLMKMTVLFLAQVSATSTAHQLGVSREHCSEWYGRYREIMLDFLTLNPITFGRDETLEADETLISALRGEDVEEGLRTQGWVLGIVGRESGEKYFEIVPNREAETILPIFEDHVEHGALIITDGSFI
jgi:hypothetical protein